MAELSGMTVNERLFIRGLLAEGDAALQIQDRAAMICILVQARLEDQADWIVETTLKKQIIKMNN